MIIGEVTYSHRKSIVSSICFLENLYKVKITELKQRNYVTGLENNKSGNVDLMCLKIDEGPELSPRNTISTHSEIYLLENFSIQTVTAHQAGLSSRVVVQTVAVCPHYHNVRPGLLLAAQAAPGPAPAGEVYILNIL